MTPYEAGFSILYNKTLPSNISFFKVTRSLDVVRSNNMMQFDKTLHRLKSHWLMHYDFFLKIGCDNTPKPNDI